MITQSWNALDIAAEKEAQALLRARKHRSVFQRRKQAKVVSRHQAEYDEHLTEHSRECYYCGRSLQDDIPTSDRTINNQFIDVCNACAFLHDLNRNIKARTSDRRPRHESRQARSVSRV